MKTQLRPALARLILFAAMLSVLVAPAVAPAQLKIEEFYDKDYGYSFQYPAGWPLRRLPEGEANRDIRAALQGPNGSSLMAIVEKNSKKNLEKGDPAAEKHKAQVEALMSQTIEQVYNAVAANIKAAAMIVDARRDISNAVAIKFYISTRDLMSDGKPIIVAGIHAFPFGKDYAVSFILSAPAEGTTAKEQETLIAVFNSFRLLGEPPAARGSDKSGMAERKKE